MDEKKAAAVSTRLPIIECLVGDVRLSGDFRLKLLRVPATDRDGPGFLALRNVPDEIDVQQPVFEVGACHVDMISKLKASLEGAGGNATMQVILALGLGRLLAGDGQGLLFDLDL